MSEKRWREHWKAQGKCVDCGHLKLIETQFTLCIDCRARRRRIRKTTTAYNPVWRKAYGQKRKDKVFEAYGGYVCACCGETTKAFLQLDHINGGENKHRKEIGGPQRTYGWLVANNFPPGFQVLCANCNWGSAQNGGICPHKSIQLAPPVQ